MVHYTGIRAAFSKCSFQTGQNLSLQSLFCYLKVSQDTYSLLISETNIGKKLRLKVMHYNIALVTFFITLSHLTWACLFNFNIQMFYYGRSKSPFTPKVKWISFRLKDVNSKSSNKPFSCAAILDCMKNKTKEKKASNHKKSSLLIWLNWLIEGQQQRHFNNNK